MPANPDNPNPYHPGPRCSVAVVLERVSRDTAQAMQAMFAMDSRRLRTSELVDLLNEADDIPPPPNGKRWTRSRVTHHRAGQCRCRG